jgi:hypothetical protein
VNTNVAATLDWFTPTGERAKVKDAKLAEPPIAPDATAFEAATSALVCTVTLPPAVGVPPNVKPVNVTVTAVLAASIVPLVMTMEDALGAAADRVAPPDTAITDGVELVEKKPDG